ncbi:MAG: endonuclease/exonuclease/phosphatase family protein [Spirochaetota bacterium]
MKTAIKIILSNIGLILSLAVLTLLFFTIVAYRPVEEIKLYDITSNNVLNTNENKPSQMDILIWNIGYASLDKQSDFVLDGGEMSKARSEKAVIDNIKAIPKFIKEQNTDIIFLQEVDKDSNRSYNVNQLEHIKINFSEYSIWFATNYKAFFVPFPFTNPMGKVHSGLATLSKFYTSSSTRYKLPGSYSWPVNTVHLKRCINLIRIPSHIENKDWCLINLHLSAYDSEGELRKQQLDYLSELMQRLYNEGNYVILGGDWNSLFPNIEKNQFAPYTTDEKNLEWIERIPEDWTPPGWTWAYDESVPTNRSLEKAYVKDENYTTIIDGYLVSPNVEIKEVKGFNLQFEHSDHNPVYIKVKAKNEP